MAKHESFGSGAPGDLASSLGHKVIKNDSGRDPAYYAKKRAAEAAAGRTLSTEEFQKEHYVADAGGSGGLSDSGTSVFDPVLCELAYSWFCPPGGSILDPFAGGSVRGIVAGVLGRRYTGIDLRPGQVSANEAQASSIAVAAAPRWIVGDAADAVALAPGSYDFLFSCPPYADLEVYSNDPRDLSTMEYAAFLAAYRGIVAACCSMLAEDRFACFVVGDVRDARGCYRGFPWDTVAAFRDAGLSLYNEAVLVTSCGSLPIRVGKQFSRSRKLGKTHQNVLVFVKGDPVLAAEACGPVEVHDPAAAFGEVIS